MKAQSALWAACLAGLILRAVAQIRVMAPESLVRGDSMRNHTHCLDSDYEVPPPDDDLAQHGGYKEVRLIHIVMVRRGQCSFVTKVKVARKKGAHAVIIVDKENSALTSHDPREDVGGARGRVTWRTEVARRSHIT